MNASTPNASTTETIRRRFGYFLGPALAVLSLAAGPVRPSIPAFTTPVDGAPGSPIAADPARRSGLSVVPEQASVPITTGGSTTCVLFRDGDISDGREPAPTPRLPGAYRQRARRRRGRGQSGVAGRSSDAALQDGVISHCNATACLAI